MAPRTRLSPSARRRSKARPIGQVQQIRSNLRITQVGSSVEPEFQHEIHHRHPFVGQSRWERSDLRIIGSLRKHPVQVNRLEHFPSHDVMHHTWLTKRREDVSRRVFAENRVPQLFDAIPSWHSATH